MLIEIDPPLDGQLYAVQGQIDRLVIAPHYAGDSLRWLIKKPVSVHIFRPVVDLTTTSRISTEDVDLIAWGEVYG